MTKYGNDLTNTNPIRYVPQIKTIWQSYFFNLNSLNKGYIIVSIAFYLRTKLFTGTVPANKNYVTVTVLANN